MNNSETLATRKAEDTKGVIRSCNSKRDKTTQCPKERGLKRTNNV